MTGPRWRALPLHREAALDVLPGEVIALYEHMSWAEPAATHALNAGRKVSDRSRSLTTASEPCIRSVSTE